MSGTATDTSTLRIWPTGDSAFLGGHSSVAEVARLRTDTNADDLNSSAPFYPIASGTIAGDGFQSQSFGFGSQSIVGDFGSAVQPAPAPLPAISQPAVANSAQTAEAAALVAAASTAGQVPRGSTAFPLQAGHIAAHSHKSSGLTVGIGNRGGGASPSFVLGGGGPDLPIPNPEGDSGVEYRTRDPFS